MKSYPVLPLRNTVLFPNQIIPIYIGRKESLKLIETLIERALLRTDLSKIKKLDRKSIRISTKTVSIDKKY